MRQLSEQPPQYGTPPIYTQVVMRGLQRDGPFSSENSCLRQHWLVNTRKAGMLTLASTRCPPAASPRAMTTLAPRLRMHHLIR